ncbi:peptide deformylase, partial [Coprococcus eutactus]|uniref:peptide deformylase n=1 Tax=Coprococcus eutactus TaxID=33043 RepID=UPI002109DCCB
MGFPNVVMLNPVLLSKSGAYEKEEGCLSLDGTRKVTSYRDIEVEFHDASFKKKRKKFNGYVAQIVLHEM